MRNSSHGTAHLRAAVPLLCCLLGLLALTDARAQESPPRAAFRLYGGYTQTNFSWSIAGTAAGTNPNILSELRWKGVSRPLAGAYVEIRVTPKWTAALSAARSLTTSGRVTDADYAEDNRTGRTYYGRFRSDRGGATQLEATASYQLVQGKKGTLGLQVGYAYDNTLLRIREGAPDPSVIATGLNSSYRTLVHGPEAALRLGWRPTHGFRLLLIPSYQWLMYRGRGNWNLATDLDHPLSFEHRANGSGWSLRLDAAWRLDRRWSIIAGACGRYVEIQSGDDILYRADGHAVRSRFNGAKGASGQVYAGVQLSFN